MGRAYARAHPQVLGPEENFHHLPVLGRQPGVVHTDAPDEPPDEEMVQTLVEALDHGVQQLLRGDKETFGLARAFSSLQISVCDGRRDTRNRQDIDQSGLSATGLICLVRT